MRVMRSRRFWILAFLLVGLVAAVGAERFTTPAEVETVRVTKRDLTQDVIITGRAEAAQSVSLSLDAGGTLAHIAVAIGDRVERGQLLASIDRGGLSAELARASAIRAATLFDARLKHTHAERELRDVQTEQSAGLERRRQAVRDAKAELDQSEDIRQQVITDRGDQSSEAKNALLAVRRAESTYGAAQHALAEAGATRLHAEHTASAALEQAHAKLVEVTQAAPDVPGLSALDADVALAQFRFRNGELRAPIAGTITAVNGDVGERVGASPLLTIETTDTIQLVADVPETDITKLSAGQQTDVTFDAIKEIAGLEATIARINPSAVLIEGVPTFRVTVALIESDARVRPGMTADIRTITGTRTSVLALPTRALVTRDGRTIATVQTSTGQTEEREVSTGLRSSDGFVEITGGLTEDDMVIVPTARGTRN